MEKSFSFTTTGKTVAIGAGGDPKNVTSITYNGVELWPNDHVNPIESEQEAEALPPDPSL